MEPSAAPPTAEPVAAPVRQPYEPGQPLERRSWQQTTGPHFIGLFLWIVYFDRLGTRALPMGGVGWSVLGAAVGGLLCYGLLYHVPAMWGFRTGRPLTEVGKSTFGETGAAWLTGIVVGVAQVVWLAVATYYAVKLTFLGLSAYRLLDPRYMRPFAATGLVREHPLFLSTALVWSILGALVGAYLVRVIAALMKVFPVFPAVALGVTMLMTIQGLKSFSPTGIDPATGEAVRDGGFRAMLLVVQLMIGFFATAGALSADWGAACRDPRDVRLGGWVGVAFASWVVATLGLLTVAGAIGLILETPGRAPSLVGVSDTYQTVVAERIGGRIGGTILLTFGLASMAPAVYASFTFGYRFVQAWPRLSRLHWTIIGTLAAWPLMASGLAGRLEAIFGIMGAVFAPLVGAMAADSSRSRGNWPGPRRGVNQAGLVAWAVGLTIGLVPTIASAWGLARGSRFQPAAVFAYLTAYVAYLVLAKLGAESPTLTKEAAEVNDSLAS